MARTKYTTRKERQAHMNKLLEEQRRSPRGFREQVTHTEHDPPLAPPSMDGYNAMRANPEYIEVAGRGHFMRRETYKRYRNLFEPYAGLREEREIAREADIREKSLVGHHMRLEKMAARTAARRAAAEAAAAEQV